MTTETEQKTPPRGWLTMCICWIGIALSHFLLLGLGIMLPAMRDEMGFSSSQAGTLRAVGGFLTALFSIPLNVWIARFSTKSVVGLSIVGMSLAYLANGLAPNYLFLLFARGFGVLISMSLLGAIVLLQGQWFPPDQMGKMNGIRQGAVNTWQIVSMAVVPLLMANLESWRTIYYIMAAAMIPTAVAWFLLGQENRTPEYEASVTAQAEAGSPVGSALRRKEIILIGLGGMGAIIVHVAFLTFWPTYVIQERGLDLTAVGPIMSTLSFGAMIASFTTGIISDRIGLRRPQLLISGLVLPAAYFALLQFGSVGTLTVTAFLVGLGSSTFWPVVLAIPFELKEISPQEIAVSVGIILAIVNGGAAIGAQLAGILIDTLGMYRALAVLCVSPLLLVACTWMLPETGPRTRAGATAIAQYE